MAATHGATKGARGTRSYSSFPREYRSWLAMRARCRDPKTIGWANYGGRGISICEDWLSDYLIFLRDMGPCPAGSSLDRIDPNGGYNPENCRWATRVEQARNTRTAPRVTFNGVEMMLADACEAAGVNRCSQRVIRFRYGLTHQEAFDQLRTSSLARARRVNSVRAAAVGAV